MCPSDTLRRRLLALACELLASEGEPIATVVVSISADDGSREHIIRSRPGEIVTPPTLDPAGQPVRVIDPTLSPLARSILTAACDVPLTAKKLAAKMGRSCNGHFREQLRMLTRRGLLSQGPDGYRQPV